MGKNSRNTFKVNRLVVLTPADPDKTIMHSFAMKLDALSATSHIKIIWRVVDSLNVFGSAQENSFSFAPTFFSMDLVSSSTTMSHAESIIYGFSLSRGEFVLMMSPDMEDNIKDIPIFVDLLEKGHEAVAAWRFVRLGVPYYRVLMTNMFNFLAKSLLRLPIHDVNTCMALASPRILECILNAPRDCPSPALYTAYKMKEKITELPIVVREIPNRKSTYFFSLRLRIGLERLRELFAFLLWVRRVRGSRACL